LWIPTRKKELWEERTYAAINSLAELEQCIYVDWNEIDCKIIDKDNIPITTWWIWTWAVWTFPIWTGWWITWEDTMYNVDIIRTKWNLQVKGKKIKLIFTNNTVWGRVRLENIEMLIEVLPWIQNNLTV
jgi:hypothetical protein